MMGEGDGEDRSGGKEEGVKGGRERKEAWDGQQRLGLGKGKRVRSKEGRNR